MDEQQYSFDAFISYRWVSPDMEWVRKQLYPALVRAGLKVCLDVVNFAPGQNSILEMEKAILDSRHVICVVTPDYFEENRMAEFEALSAQRRDPAGRKSFLIPLVLREANIPDRMRGLIPTDWTNPEDYAREWKRLLELLKAGNPDAPPPRAPEGRQGKEGEAPKDKPEPKFWNAPSINHLSRVHERAAPCDPTVLVIFVHGAGGHAVRTWGDLPARLLADVGTDADVISYANPASSTRRQSIAEAAARLRRIILNRPRPYMHIFFVTHGLGGLVVKELLAGDVESVREQLAADAGAGGREDACELDLLPPVAGKTRAVFNFAVPLREADEASAYVAELGERLRRSLALLKASDFARPRIVEFVAGEGAGASKASAPDPESAEVFEVIRDGGGQKSLKPPSRRDDPRVEAVVERMSHYFNSEEMSVSYLTLRRFVVVGGGISPTSDAADSQPGGDELARNDWVGWDGSQRFILNRLAQISSPREMRAHPRVLVTGSAGVGKSTILRRHARQSAARFLERRPGAPLCVYIPMQNLVLDKSELQLMPPSGTSQTGWGVVSNFSASLVHAILRDSKEETAFADADAAVDVKSWESVRESLTGAWLEARAVAEPTKILLDGVDEFIVNNSPLTVETVTRLLEVFESPLRNTRTQCIMAARSTLPAISELSSNKEDTYEISPLSESAADEMFPGTRDLLRGLPDQSLRPLLLSFLILFRLGPRASRITRESLNTRASILRQALEALIEESQLTAHGQPPARGFRTEAWVQALALVAWLLYRDNRGFITVSELIECVRELKPLWSRRDDTVSHCYAEGMEIIETPAALKALRSRTVLNSVGKELVRFTHREWQDFLVSDYLAHCVIGQTFPELNHTVSTKQVYIDAAEVLWQEMTRVGMQIDSSWVNNAFADEDPFEYPVVLLNVCALLGNGPVDVEQSAFQKLMGLICDPRCPERTRLVAVSSFGMRVLRGDKRDRSIRFMLAEMVDSLGRIVQQGVEPHRKVSASMAWCYRAELWRRHPHLPGAGGGEPWPALSATSDAGVEAAEASGIVWKREGDSIVVDARCRSFQIAAAQYPLAVRGLLYEEISLTHYLFLAAATLRVRFAAASEIYPLLRAVFDEENGVAERVNRSALPEVKELFESCRRAARTVLAEEAT